MARACARREQVVFGVRADFHDEALRHPFLAALLRDLSETSPRQLRRAARRTCLLQRRPRSPRRSSAQVGATQAKWPPPGSDRDDSRSVRRGHRGHAVGDDDTTSSSPTAACSRTRPGTC
ncbi:hypothetical protein ACSHWB_35135 [Lentzea sp. HUAS TT2]|uniref:hypothetical protein n=1 Tax=Lentzea sp. HUAS TT2 TaxID=3447454 RepID=UPI003F6FD8B7